MRYLPCPAPRDPATRVARTTPYGLRPSASPVVRGGAARQTGAGDDDGAQARVAARVPGAAALGLVAAAVGARSSPRRCWPIPDWTAERARPPARRGSGPATGGCWRPSGGTRRRTVLLTPALAGLVTGVPLSARLADTSLAFLLAGGLPVAAVSSAPGRRRRPRSCGRRWPRSSPRWPRPGGCGSGRCGRSPPTRSPTSCSRWAGRSGDVPRGDRAGRAAGRRDRRAAAGAALRRRRRARGSPGGRRAAWWSSCRGGSLCTSCPRRPPAERAGAAGAAPPRWF